MCGFEAIAGNFKHFSALAFGANLFRVGLQYNGRHHIAIVGVFIQRFVNGIVKLLCIGGKANVVFRAAVNLAALEIHDAAAQRFVSSSLVRSAYGGLDVQAARVSFVAILIEHQLTHHFCNVFRVNGVAEARRANL